MSLAETTFKCVVKTAEEAGVFVCTILHSIQKAVADVEQFIRDVVAFFEMLFDWDDILRTHDALRQMLQSAMKYAQSPQLKKDAGALIADLAAKVGDGLTHVRAIQSDPSKLQPASAYADEQARASGGLPNSLSMPIVAGAASHKHLQQHASRCHYVSHHARSHSAVQPAKNGGVYDATHAAKWKAAGSTQFATLSAHAKKTPSASALLATQPDPDLVAIFADLVDVARDGADAVAREVLGMTKGAVGAIDDALEKPASIPVISFLYKHVITDGDDLDLLDLFCLILAVPGTILFKLITEDVAPFDGGAPVSDGDMATLRALFPDEGPWSLKAAIAAAFDAETDPAADRGSVAMSPINRYAMMLSILSAVMGLFGSSISTVLDYYACENAAESAPSSEDQAFLGYASTILAAIATLMSVPLTTFAGGDEAQIATSTLYWASQFLPVASDAASLQFNNSLTKMFGEGVGAVAEGLFGILIATLGIVYAFEGGASHWDIAGMAMNCFPRPWRLLIAGIDPETVDDYPVLMPFIMATDAVGILGGTATTIGAAIVDNR